MIHSISSANFERIIPLINAYQQFYNVDHVSAQQNRSFFSQFGMQSDKGCQFAYFDGTEPVAFATVYFCYSSTLTAKVGVLNDLYTLPSHRNKGIASKLIKHCAKFAIERGACRLQWVTARDNTTAQALYKKLGAKQSSWEFFSYTP
ncbi:GNAT family N-acetyltransferase [Saccharophagus degradans]|uniref:GCN5-related N-acetyltransferase n=1 Tax=Saccharophagus degradans (strain 2-40 / ATCC 43961 / DSM 17024) TaxID=203122 RepID=Q21EG3_SACD2|nr:GNAT family N-acetyltransferase [Saccharophagus degradans]ABD82916.1 GCN5-related N-acetyltransferase [Saccharophagus degradans 2-40]